MSICSSSREGRPTIDHRFNGGISDEGTLEVPPGTKDTRKIAAGSKTSEVSEDFGSLKPSPSFAPMGLGGLLSRKPTIEMVGYCRMSLAGQNARWTEMGKHQSFVTASSKFNNARATSDQAARSLASPSPGPASVAASSSFVARRSR